MSQAGISDSFQRARREVESWPLSMRRDMRIQNPERVPYRPDPALRGPGIWIVECPKGCRSPWFDEEGQADACALAMDSECQGPHTPAEFVRAEPRGA